MVECYEICVRLVNEFTVCFQALFGRTFYSQEGASIQPRSSRKNAISAVGAKVAINCISMAQALGNRHEARTKQQYSTRSTFRFNRLFPSIFTFQSFLLSFHAFGSDRYWFAFFACSDGVDGTRDDWMRDRKLVLIGTAIASAIIMSYGLTVKSVSSGEGSRRNAYGISVIEGTGSWTYFFNGGSRTQLSGSFYSIFPVYRDVSTSVSSIDSF